ncbi:proton-translocating transhydrogenase family protein [Arthrobacter bambusae]|uniref:proton-translocating transhydrogenase family protein n=1 Tax=Arthrobacter bambusae TaxID=1338426 RepID=UPI001F5F3CD0|nr:proton-translocating transhydrogenase family protein [Arthrobacter bambusae]
MTRTSFIQCKNSSTALIPGRPAPKLLTAEEVAGTKPGTVIVYMDACQGGNFEGSAHAAKKTGLSPASKAGMFAAGIAVLIGTSAVAPAPLPRYFTVLMLSIVVGFYVIGKVHHALHTPPMSVTNAIPGLIVVGALQVTSENPMMPLLEAVAVLLASINILGGFAVTRHLLAMFSRGEKPGS